MVSLLSLRINLFNEQGQLISAAQEWAATPVCLDSDWRGPILPGSRRYFVCGRSLALSSSPFDLIKTEVEINELRVWNDQERRPRIHKPVEEQATAAIVPEPQELVVY